MDSITRANHKLSLLIFASLSFLQLGNLPQFDFANSDAVQEWRAIHDVARLRGTSEGMQIDISGSDPYIAGPARDYPEGQSLWLRIRIRSGQGGTGQIFYFARGTSEEDSVHFTTRRGLWEELRIPIPPLGPATRLRIDPPGDHGSAVVAWIKFEHRVILKEPDWPRPVSPALDDGAVSVRSGPLRLSHSKNELGGFVVEVDGQRMAIGNTRMRIGYLHDNSVHWIDLDGQAHVTLDADKKAIIAKAVARDNDGGTWEIRNRFNPSSSSGAIDVDIQVMVDQDRSVVFLPMIILLPGSGSFGESKTQGLFAGLEYLDNEPSSSEADVTGPASRRQVPDSIKITFPLMAIAANDRYVGLIWDKSDSYSALFDSPDRIFHSGGHVMGVLFPHSDGTNRVEGNLLPYDGETVKRRKALTVRATIIGGRGRSVVPAMQQYISLRGFPETAIHKGGLHPGYSTDAYVRFAGGGWLDSKIRVGKQWRHAYWPGSDFGPQPAADAAVFMKLLARLIPRSGETGVPVNSELHDRLEAAASDAVSEVSPQDYDSAGVSHVRYPVASLVFGHVAENTKHAREMARALLSRFEPDGSVLYRKSPDRPDFGKTHFAPDANGLTAEVVLSVLRAATVCGDRLLIDEGLRKLRGLDKFTNTVPRGAQTWEVPLHTPDILASANLVAAYTIGYELTGDSHFLEQARYWAWTGVPFVYLSPPTSQRVGLYATTAVFGATHWKAPVWMGLPVQWCGLVYADAVYRLAKYEPHQWTFLNELPIGIAISGIQQSWPASDPDLQGLLPDSFNLRTQTRNPVAINPGTVQANALHLYLNRHHADFELYDFHAFRAAGLLVHAPGKIWDMQDQSGGIRFKVRGWTGQPYYVLIVGLTHKPHVRINDKDITLADPHQYMEREGRLILRVEGSPSIEAGLEG